VIGTYDQVRPVCMSCSAETGVYAHQWGKRAIATPSTFVGRLTDHHLPRRVHLSDHDRLDDVNKRLLYAPIDSMFSTSSGWNDRHRVRGSNERGMCLAEKGSSDVFIRGKTIENTAAVLSGVRFIVKEREKKYKEPWFCSSMTTKPTSSSATCKSPSFFLETPSPSILPETFCKPVSENHTAELVD
jgi:hypothetical protein